jgi:hypothetical protein
MENEEITTSRKKGGNSTMWLVLGALGLGAIAYWFYKNKSDYGSPGIFVDKSAYKLGYWMWSILKVPALATDTFNRAKSNGRELRTQLSDDAQLKVTGTVGSDFDAFCTLVDERLKLMLPGKTIADAINYVIGEQMKLAYGNWVKVKDNVVVTAHNIKTNGANIL